MAASALSSAGVSSLFSVGRTSRFPLNTAAISSSRGVRGCRHKVGGLLNRKSVYAVMMTASRFYSLSLTFSCLNFPIVFSRWTSDFWRGNCSCSACIKNTSVQEYSLDYMIQVLYMLCPQTQTDNEGLSSKCVRLFTQYYPKYLFKYIFIKNF